MMQTKSLEVPQNGDRQTACQNDGGPPPADPSADLKTQLAVLNEKFDALKDAYVTLKGSCVQPATFTGLERDFSNHKRNCVYCGLVLLGLFGYASFFQIPAAVRDQMPGAVKKEIDTQLPPTFKAEMAAALANAKADAKTAAIAKSNAELDERQMAERLKQWNAANRLTGTWTNQTHPEFPALILQTPSGLMLRNEKGQWTIATLSADGTHLVAQDSMEWRKIDGTVSADGQRIDWEAGQWRKGWHR